MTRCSLPSSPHQLWWGSPWRQPCPCPRPWSAACGTHQTGSSLSWGWWCDYVKISLHSITSSTLCGCDLLVLLCQNTGLASCSLMCQNMGTDNIEHVIKSSANLQNPPFFLQTPRENHRDRSSEVLKSWIAQIFWHGNSQFVLTRRKSVSLISFWWQVQFPLVTNYWRRGPNQDETRLVNQSSWITVW